MNDDYFKSVVSSLTIDDMKILGILYDHEADAGFKALLNADVCSSSGLSEATYRRIIYRLEANKFIEIINVKKQNAIYITKFGISAVLKSVEGVSA
jgi:transcription initiation factor IIE alpha subunit